MKATILTILILFGIFFNGQAQRFNAGFVGGMATTQVDGDSHAGYNKVGPIGGVWVGFRLSPVYYARMEFRYIQKGSYAKDKQEGSTSFYRMRLNYFEIPILLAYRLRNGFNPIIGVSGGYLIKAKEMTEMGLLSPEDIQKFRKFEFAGLVGFEYNKSERWAFNLIYSYSFLPIRPYQSNSNLRWTRGQYNNVLELVVRYKL